MGPVAAVRVLLTASGVGSGSDATGAGGVSVAMILSSVAYLTTAVPR
ncbi:MAG TPA: hypothetical protein VFJ00_03270 [Candidatus Limnocylindria bacterium]|nr:hypothetical protein [Candidatus Limnocylindria bacterium]